MVFRPKIDEKLCFVLMPFGAPFDGYYQKIIKPAAATAALDTLRSDEIYSTKPIVQDIWNKIWQARVIVADVTNKNPNVNYELGLCHALGIPTIIITRNIDDVPFDYRHRRCIPYRVEDAGWEEKLRTDLANTIQAVLSDTTNADELDWPYDTTRLDDSTSGSVLIASGDSRKVVIRGAQVVRSAIASAYGPLGQRVAVSGGSVVVQRGIDIAKSVRSLNPLEEKGIEEIRGAASHVFNSAGDGTKLVAMLAAGFMSKGQELIEKGHAPKAVLDLFDRDVERILGYLTTNSEQPDDFTLRGVASTAAHGDLSIGDLVFEAVKRAGKDGVITLETSREDKSRLELLEGMRFDRGFLSEKFITDLDQQEAILENCLVVVHEKKLSSMRDLLPVLEKVAASGRGLLVIAEDVEGEALSTLVVNKLRGTLQCIAVRSPGFDERRRHLLEDIATLTGAKAITADLGVPLATVSLRDLGTAQKVIVSKAETTIIGGGGSPEAIAGRAKTIRAQILDAPNGFEQEKLQERLAMLVGKIAVLKAGGTTDVDVVHERYKLSSAMFSTRSAAEYGCVPGGGVALLRATVALEQWRPNNEMESAVRQAVVSVVEEPIRQLIQNSKRSPTLVLEEIRKSLLPSIGFNVMTDVNEDLMKSGVVDSVFPIRSSVQVALSYARSVLQTGAWDMSPT